MGKDTKFAIVKAIMAVLLLLCLAPMSYSYYMAVRILAMAIFAIVAWQHYQRKETEWFVTYGILALLLQPFLKVALGRGLWNLVDIIAAALLIKEAVRTMKKLNSQEG